MGKAETINVPIYLDYLSTTPVDPRVAAAMAPYASERFGHPASRQHAFGWDAEKAVDDAREQVAALLACRASEIVFTPSLWISLPNSPALHSFKMSQALIRGALAEQENRIRPLLENCI